MPTNIMRFGEQYSFQLTKEARLDTITVLEISSDGDTIRIIQRDIVLCEEVAHLN